MDAPAPAPVRSRLHWAALILVGLAGLARGLYWSATLEVFSPVDEAHHYAYVAGLVEERRIPVMGRDQVPLEVLQIRKESPTLGARITPRRADLSDRSWEAELEQYEAIQPPLYYLLAAPVYWVTRGLDSGATVFALRAFTVLLSTLAVPLTWALARRIFPEHPGIWLASPALLVVVNGFNSNLAAVSNDALVPVAGTALLLAGVSFVQAPGTKRAAVLGVVMGLSILTKLVLVAMIPVVGLLFLPLLRRNGYGIKATLRSGMICALAGVVLVAPWLAYNLATYQAPTAAHKHYEIIGPYLTQSELSLGTLRNHAVSTHAGFWERELRPDGPGRYERVWDLALVAAAAVAALGVVAGWRRREMIWVVWLGIGLPLSFLISEATFMVLFDGRGQTVGRYLYGALPATCIVLAAWPFIVGGWRLGWVWVGAVAAAALTVEMPATRLYVVSTYSSGILASGEVPVVDQSLNQGSTSTTGIRADPPCPVSAFGLSTLGEPPPVLRITGGEGVQEAVRHESVGFDMLLPHDGPQLTLYRTPTALSHPFVVEFAGPLEVFSASSTGGGLGFADGPGSPVGRLYCRVPDAASVRFDQKYPPLHPVPMSLGSALAWPGLWRIAGWMGLLGALASALGDLIRGVQRKGRKGTVNGP